MAINASTQRRVDKLRPPAPVVASSITGQMSMPPKTTPTPTPKPVQTAVPDFIGQPVKKVATTTNPVITRSAPAPTSITPPANEITSRDDNKIKDFVAWAELNPSKLSIDDKFKLKRGQQVLQERAYQQTNINPYKEQITQEETLRKQREAELKQRDQALADARRRELELTYGKRIAGEQEAGQKTMSAAQGVLSFSGFGRSTYAAEKQAEIQQQVNENINILNAERDYAIAKYEAELRGATAEELASYDQNIADLRNRSAQFSAQLAQQMNEYNMQTAASYEERINNVLQLAQSLETVELTPGQQEEAGAYATLLIDNEGNINEKLLADIPPTLKGIALKKAAELKAGMPKKIEAPETIKADDGSVYAFNDQTGEFEKIIGGKPMQSDKTVKVKDPNGNETIMQYNTQTGKYDIPVQPGGFTPNGTPVSQAIQTALEKCKTGAQCGKFVNDVLQGVGLPRLVKDSYQSKEMAISQIGIATSYDDMGSGSIFAYPVKGSNYGHIGIITGVNDDGTIDIMDYNYKGDEQRRERKNVDPTEIINMGGRISKPIIREDTVIESASYDPKVQKMAESIIKGVGDYPSKNDKNYINVVSAVNDLLEKKKASTNDYQLQSIYDSSKYEKTVSDTGIKQIQDIKTVIGGVENLTKQLSKEYTGPIVGYLKNKNPRDVDAGAITAQINQLAPKVARGVFGEVGVLTDSDIERYLKTIPNLKQTKDLGSVVGDLLKIAVYKSFINTVVTNAQGGRNMSNFVTDYEKAKKRLEKKGVSPLPFDNSQPTQPTQTAPAKKTAPQPTVKDPLGILDL